MRIPTIAGNLLLCFALSWTPAHGEPPEAADEEARIEMLKRAYLSCSDAALRGRLQTGAVQQCSVIYEELKWRAFGGDFLRLFVWSRAQADRQRTRD